MAAGITSPCPRASSNANLMRDGVGFDGSAVGLKSVKAGDMVLAPDLSTAFPDPFWDAPTLSFICSAFEADTKLPFARDPRNIAQRAEEYMQEIGIADESRWGPEYEFYIFDNVAFENDVNTASYRRGQPRGRLAQRGRRARSSHSHARRLSCHSARRFNSYNLRSEMSLVLEEMGVEVKYHHHEVGGPGQCEIETPMMGSAPIG